MSKAAQLTTEQIIGSARIAKEMAVRSIDDAICIVALRDRDGVLPPDTVATYVGARLDAARQEIDRMERVLKGGV